MEAQEAFLNLDNALLNTREVRYKQVDFSIEKREDNSVVLKNGPAELNLTLLDEVVLYIILIYRYMPFFLAKKFVQSSNFIGQEESRLVLYRDFGLIYEYPTPIGTLLMPTEKLALLFGEKLGPFTNPNYNLFTHTVSEQKVMFECMIGEAQFLKDIPHIPYISKIGLQNNKEGTTAISEEQYSISRNFFYQHLKDYNDAEAKLREEIKAGKQITTPDIKEQNLMIFKKRSTDKYDYKIPDIAILAPRKIVNGIAFPQSTAIEVELTDKGIRKYTSLLQLYYSNIKFGKVIYLTPDGKIRDTILKAWKKIDRSITQTCELEILDFVMPYDEGQLL